MEKIRNLFISDEDIGELHDSFEVLYIEENADVNTIDSSTSFQIVETFDLATFGLSEVPDDNHLLVAEVNNLVL